MSFGAKPMGPPPVRPRPQARGEVAFAIGSRALITPTGNAGQVQLLDEDGMPVDRHLRGDIQVMITAWRPRRSAPPRYRVCSAEQVEGWIDAANLRRLPPPPPPAPLAVTAPPPPPPAPAKPPKKPVVKPAPAKAEAKAPKAKAPAAKAVAQPAPKVAPKPAPKAPKVQPTTAQKAPAARAKPPATATAAKLKKGARASKRTR